jgi:hypothetical protein
MTCRHRAASGPLSPKCCSVARRRVWASTASPMSCACWSRWPGRSYVPPMRCERGLWPVSRGMTAHHASSICYEPGRWRSSSRPSLSPRCA